MMLFIDHDSVDLEWRGKDRNIEHRTIIDDESGSQQMTLWDVRAIKDTGAPPHVHQHEETITVLSGSIKIKIDREIFKVNINQTIFIPVNAAHSFAVISERAHLLVAFPVKQPQWERVTWDEWYKILDEQP